MRRKRRLHKSGFKTTVALTAIRGEMTMAQMVKKFDVQAACPQAIDLSASLIQSFGWRWALKIKHDTVAKLCKGLIENRLQPSKRQSTAVNGYIVKLLNYHQSKTHRELLTGALQFYFLLAFTIVTLAQYFGITCSVKYIAEGRISEEEAEKYV